jgi:nitroreductase
MYKTIAKALSLIILTTLIMTSCKNDSKSSTAKSTNAAIETIMNRKSVRQYTSQKLTDEQIQTLLKAAMAAPSAINIQPWQFVVITDTAVAASLTTGHVNQMYKDAAALFVICGDTTCVRVPKGAPEGTEPVEQPNMFWTADCAAATENLLLAAESMGLGAVWTACYPAKDRYPFVHDALGLPANVLPYSIVPVGYPAGDNQPKDKFKPEKIHYNKW